MNTQTPYSSYENLFLLHTMFSARKVRLDHIGKESLKQTYPIVAVLGNNEADIEMQDKFTTKEWKPSEGIELHSGRCMNAGVEHCICLADKAPRGLAVTGGAF